MKKALIFIILATVAFNVSATGRGGQGGAGGAAISNSSADAFASSSASNRAVLEGMQYQSTSVFDSGSSLSNTTNFNSNGVVQKRNNPGMFLGIPSPTANCMAVMGGGAIFSGVGFTAAGSMTNKDCVITETAKSWWQRGDIMTGDEVMCQATDSKNTVKCMEIELATINRKNELSRQIAELKGVETETRTIQRRVETKDQPKPFDASDW